MKKITALFTAVMAVALVAFKPIAPVAYKVDTQKSKIEWTGKKVLGSHSGTIKLSSGTITANGKVPTGGTFVIDMNSMENTDLPDAESKGKLLGHLKSDDFFGVSKYPTATFVATKIAPAGGNNVNVTGNLTIKGKTEAISFPAKYVQAGNTITVTANEVKVNRTKYDIKYGSKSFFESIGDKAIDDDFLLNINLVATR
ncbi:YceI family protein [Mucilaginibacter sp. Bleaf8]|uniref:YceI family protein n=1 Tax=Mucilaginibacter sp. Bleaf8 TaxID=2834430 RepID=UPI001BCC6CDB|nr:YceI family protein [Mucilaginibacter sp. Bleaf8]MBS7566038.1 YceI family protein [Mucilaginibacter sp. Bleaf8]